MTVQAFSQRPPGPAEYALGHHYRWEVEAHIAEDEFYKKKGLPWTLHERRRWISRYFNYTTPSVQYEVIECPVCSVEVANALMEGRKPYACPPGIKEQLRRLTAKFGTTLGIRKRHIDTV